MSSTKRERVEETDDGLDLRNDPPLAANSSEFVLGMLDTHSTQLAHTASVRRSALALVPLTQQDRDDADAVVGNECVHFMRRPDDRFIGCARLRTAMAILSEVDQRGFERSTHQQRFHDAFIRASSRVIYKEEWAVHRAAIMRKNEWDKTPSEIVSGHRSRHCATKCT